MTKNLKGRFRKQFDKEALKFSSSINVDFKLFREDIEGSIAHCKMLSKQKIISSAESRLIQKVLNEIKKEIENGKITLDYFLNDDSRFSADDIHMAVEKLLIQKKGDVGGKLHTARSRNDQIALDERLYLRSSINSIQKLIISFQKTLVQIAEENIEIIISGYTHLQQAQPVLLSHHLLAYVSMLQRDNERLHDCSKRVNINPLGAGALAGSTFKIDRNYTAKLLKFDGVLSNSLDAVSDRDAAIEFISICSIIMMHLSRFMEELIIWNSQEWNFVEIGDEFTTGSSMMPQKKNPDIAELIRGKTGRVYGDLISLLTLMKGLPLAYNRDMQEDKEPMFDASYTVSNCLSICVKMLGTIKFNPDSFLKKNTSDLLLATDIADYLVNKKVPFRKAHMIVSSLTQYCISKKISFKEVPLNMFQNYSPLFQKDIYKLLGFKESLNQKKSEGSTSPREVRKEIKYWNRKLK